MILHVINSPSQPEQNMAATHEMQLSLLTLSSPSYTPSPPPHLPDPPLHGILILRPVAHLPTLIMPDARLAPEHIARIPLVLDI